MNDDLPAAMRTAVVAGDADAVRSLLARGADPRGRLRPAGADFDRPLLEEACHRGHADVVQALAEAGVELGGDALCTAASHPNAAFLQRLLDMKPWGEQELQNAFRSAVRRERAACAVALVSRATDWSFRVELGAGGPLPLVHALVLQRLFEVLEALAPGDTRLRQALPEATVAALRLGNLASLRDGTPLDLARAVLDAQVDWKTRGDTFDEVDRQRLERAAQTRAWLEQRLEGKVGAATRRHLPQARVFASEGDRVEVVAGKARGARGVVKQTPPGPNPEYRRLGVLTDEGRIVWAMQKEVRRLD